MNSKGMEFDELENSPSGESSLGREGCEIKVLHMATASDALMIWCLPGRPGGI